MLRVLRIYGRFLYLWLTGEPVFIVLLDPRRTRTFSETQGMSAELINDGLHSAVNTLINDGTIRARLSQEELDWLAELQNNGGNKGE